MGLLVSALEFIRTHWRKCAVCGAVVASFAAGRGFTPPAEIRETERVVFKDRIVERVVTQAAEVKHVIVYREKVTKPDGTVTEKVTEKTDTNTKTETDKGTETMHEGARVTERVVTSKPDWRVGIMGGAAVSFAPLSASPLLGAHVERRIVGPFSLGVWSLVETSKLTVSAGLSVSAEF